MRKALIVLALLVAGCTIPTKIERKVTVEKDADGRIVRILEEETASQTVEGQIIVLERIRMQAAPKPHPDQPSALAR